MTLIEHDARGVEIRLQRPASRIISLVPSTTETLFDLGVGDHVVGVTRFCCRPKGVSSTRPRIGGTKDPDLDRIRALAPDLILGNCEENTREGLADLAEIAPVWAAFPRTIDDALDDLEATGRLVGSPTAATTWATKIRQARAHLTAATPDGPRALYLIWRKPWMAAGPDTFIDRMMAARGWRNAWEPVEPRFPEVTAEQIRNLAPDELWLSSEPFPFRPKHAEELSNATGIPIDRMRFVDGELHSWHGTRMLRAFSVWASSDPS